MPINYYCSIGMVGSNIEMNKNQLLEPVIENSASQPSSPVEGQMYYDTTVGDKKCTSIMEVLGSKWTVQVLGL